MRLRLVPALLLVAVFAIAVLLWRSRRNDALVVYCAHDAIFSESILREFERRSGVPVAIRFDTEATKSLGLTELIQREKDAPRCDVFWNNELLGMADLQERGLLEPYLGSGFARIPAAYKDSLGHWAGFAARFRVYIFNTEQLGSTVGGKEVDRVLQTPDLSRVAIAKPIFGTTLTHYSVLWQTLGAAATQKWHRDWRARKVREVGGNAAVKDLVASGACLLGLTDTDDFYAAKDARRPVAALPVRLAAGTTICIPNTVGIIRGARHPEAARQLVDYLLSAETELALAHSASRQVPLGPVADDQLPADVRAMRPWVAEAFPLAGLSRVRAECLAWLQTELKR